MIMRLCGASHADLGDTQPNSIVRCFDPWYAVLCFVCSLSVMWCGSLLLKLEHVDLINNSCQRPSSRVITRIFVNFRARYGMLECVRCLLITWVENPMSNAVFLLIFLEFHVTKDFHVMVICASYEIFWRGKYTGRYRFIRPGAHIGR